MKAFVLALITISSVSAHALDQRLIFSVSACAYLAELIGPNERPECFSVIDTGQSAALVEVHNQVCGGDPNTGPARAHFTFKNGKLGYEAGIDDWKACP